MSTTWGQWVRTAVELADGYSGTLYANLFPSGSSVPHLHPPGPATGVSLVTVTALGCSASIIVGHAWTYDPYNDRFEDVNDGGYVYPGDPIYEALSDAGVGVDDLGLLTELRAQCGWDGFNLDTQSDYRVTFLGEVMGGTSYYWLSGPTEITAEFSLSFANVLLKRRRGVTLPELPGGGQARQHLHPLDEDIEDSWHATPGATSTATIGDATASATRRDLYPTQTDPAIGDLNVGNPQFAYAIRKTANSAVADALVGSIACDEIDFTGLDIEVATNVRAVADGATATLVQSDTADRSAQWNAYSYSPLDYAWARDAAAFFDEETLNPTVSAGFVDAAGDPLTHALSDLPNSPEPPAHSWGDPYRAHPSDTFTVEIDAEWARTEFLAPAKREAYGGDSKVAELHDRYICLSVPGVDGVVQHTPIGLTGVEVGVLPLVERAYDPTDVRWSGSTGVTVDPSAQETWLLAAGLTGGSVSAELQTRYWERMALLGLQGVEKVWRWPWVLKARAAGVVDTVDEPTFVEDVFSWKDFGWLRIGVTRPDDAAISWTLTVYYYTVTVSDPRYTCGGPRADDFSYSRSPASCSYEVAIPEGEAHVDVDLLCPSSDQPPYLFVVDRIVFSRLANAGGEAIEVTLNELTLQPAAGSILEFHGLETWDYLTDWEGACLQRDGQTRLAELPDEPARNEGPETGWGYIEKVEHCPGSSAPGELHHVRNLSEIHTSADWQQGLAASWSTGCENAWLKSYWKGAESPEILCSPAWYWCGDRLVETTEPASGSVSPRCEIRVASWKLARGTPYTLTVRKRLAGAGRALLRTSDGTARVTPDTVSSELRYLIWRRVSYVKQDFSGSALAGWTTTETPIEWPGSPLPETDTYHEVAGGLVSARLDANGVFTTPGLAPSRTQIEHDDCPQSFDTYYLADVTYHLALWDGDGWDEYDLDDESEFAAFQADSRLQSWTEFETAGRRWTGLDLAAGGLSIAGGNLVRTRAGTQLVTRGGQVWSRLGALASWLPRHDTTELIPLLLHVIDTDDIALLDHAVQQTRRLGITWEDGRPNGLPEAIETWRSAGTLTDARVGDEDKLLLGVGLAGNTLVVVGREESGGVAAPVEIATLTPAELSGLWPWVYRAPTGDWVVGCFANAVYREWRGNLDGSSWIEGVTQELGESGRLTACAWWGDRHGLEVVAGYCSAARRINVWTRGGPGLNWTGPYLEATVASGTQPYVYIRRTGPVEVGWLLGDEWTRYLCEHPADAWSEL